MTTKYDPVEAAKLPAPDAPKSKKKTAAPPPAELAAEPPQPPVRVTPPKPARPMTAEQEAAFCAPHAKFRVTRGGKVSWYGAITSIAEGSIVDSDGYGGPAGIYRLYEAGIDLEPA